MKNSEPFESQKYADLDCSVIFQKDEKGGLLSHSAKPKSQELQITRKTECSHIYLSLRIHVLFSSGARQGHRVDSLISDMRLFSATKHAQRVLESFLTNL